jgi:hypothetical protein
MKRRRLTSPASRATALLLAAALLLSTAPVLPRGWEAAQLAADRGDAAAVADYRLKHLSPDDYARAIETALATGDADLADSLTALARRQALELPAPLVSRVDAAIEEAGSASRMAGDAWDGFLSGNAESESALAGALAADLSGFGDVRDLSTQAGNYVTGAEVDTTTVALAAVGIGLTAATVLSLGAALPEKAGVSLVKVVNRMGRLSRPLRAQVIRLGRDAVDTQALRTFAGSLRSFDVSAIRAAAKRIVRPGPAAKLKQLGADVATLGKNAGYRGTLDVLAKADDATAISRLARMSRTFGKATRGALFMLGDAALTLAVVAGTVFSWTAGAIAWILAAVWLAVRLGVWGVRLSFVALVSLVRLLRGAASPGGSALARAAQAFASF